MNFYKRFIGDIQSKTGHLSLAEFGAYDRLLDHYYSTEKPLPADIEACCRIARAMGKEEKKAVESVLRQFFDLSELGYSQRRADEMIADAQPKIEANRTNGRLGGRPKKQKTETQEKPNGFSEKTQSEPNENLSQSQITTSLRSVGKRASAPPCPNGVEAQTWGDWLTLRKSKRAPVTQTVIAEACKQADIAGMSLEDFLRAWCRRGSQGLEAAWLKPEERRQSAGQVGETPYQRNQRETIEALAPGVARRSASVFPGLEPITLEAEENGGCHVAALEGR